MTFSLTALLCPLLFLAFIVAVIVLIIRSAVRTVSNVAAGAAKPPLNVITQLGPDGFWLSSFEPSSVIYYEYWAAGAKYSGQIVFQPGSDGRQFVYTGSRPDRVAVLRAEGPSGTSAIPPTIIDDSGPDITAPIIGAAAAEAAFDAISNAAQPPPPPPPQFPGAY